MDVETKLELSCKAPAEEVITREEMKALFETKSQPVHYIGMEVSGKLHLGSLLMNGFKINDFAKAGIRTQVLLADWHSVINNKLEGNWEKIKRASKYYEEAFKFFCPSVKITRGSELYENNNEYWKEVIMFSKHLTLARTERCLSILGRRASETTVLARYFYPPMQAIDIKHLGADIAHAGMDQRKIHMVAREVFPKMGFEKPIAVHHHILAGLSEPEKIDADIHGLSEKEEEVYAMKMSKSKPYTAIFIHDTEEEIKDKLKKAYCPPSTEGNPVLELAKYVVFHEQKELNVERPEKYGGNVVYENYAGVEKDYLEKKLHPSDLKNAVGNSVEKIIAPIRKHFEGKKEMMKVFEETAITR